MNTKSGISLGIMGLVVCVFVWMIEVTAGFDRLTTIAVDTALGRAIVYVPSALFAIFCIHALLTGKAGSETLKRLKVIRPSLWYLNVFVLGVLTGLGCFFMLKILVGSTAQHLDGKSGEYELHVDDVTRINGRKNQCLIEVKTREIPGFDAASFCIVTRNGVAIGPKDLQTGETIHLVTKSTPLGTVAMRVTRGLP